MGCGGKLKEMSLWCFRLFCFFMWLGCDDIGYFGPLNRVGVR